MDLIRGQRTKLKDLTADTRVKVGITLEGPRGTDVACVALLLGHNQEAISPNALVCTQQPKSECGGVSTDSRSGLEHSFDVDLRLVAPAASSVLFAVGLLGSGTASARTAGDLRRGSWAIDAGGRTVARYSFSGSDFGNESAIAIGELYRKDGVWRLRAIGEGFVGGLPAMLSRYRVTPSVVHGRGPDAGISSAPSGFVLPATWAGDRAPVVPRDLTRSVGLIVARTHQGTVHTGTGFIVSPGGSFITCSHVVEDAVNLAICLDGTRLLRPAEVLARDPVADLALCWICDRNGSPDWLILGGRDANPSLGDELGLLGFPLGVDLGLSVTYSQGIINSLRQRGEAGQVSVLQIDVGAAPGSSGGPVFRRSDGKVLGVLTSGLDVQERGMLINFAVDIRMLWRLGWVT